MLTGIHIFSHHLILRLFYMHTDQHSLDHLKTDFAILNPNVKFNISSVPAAYQSQVLNLVTDPNNIGCGHLRNVLIHSDQYDTNSNLTASFIRVLQLHYNLLILQTFYTYLWNHAAWDAVKLHGEDLTVLEGDHKEQAILKVVGVVDPSDPCADYSKSPKSSYILIPFSTRCRS